MKKMNFFDVKESKKEEIENPHYKKYTKEYSMTAVDPSLVWDKICGGNRKPKLSSKVPKRNEAYYEYGFDGQGKCIYRKCYDNQYAYMNGIDICYVYDGNIIYQIPRSKNLAEYSEFHFDERGRVIEIYKREKYEWLDEEVAIVTDQRNSRWLTIQGKEDLWALFWLIESKNIESYNTGNFVDKNNYKVKTYWKLDYSSVDVSYATILDIQEKTTEYVEINVLNNTYIGKIVYLKPPKDFQYSKAKSIYKQEMLGYILRKLESSNNITYIGIQYFNGGYSILDVNLGFDQKKTDAISQMQICEDMCFSQSNMEVLQILDGYINQHMYFNAFRKLMKEIKKELEDNFKVTVILEEISD